MLKQVLLWTMFCLGTIAYGRVSVYQRSALPKMYWTPDAVIPNQTELHCAMMCEREGQEDCNAWARDDGDKTECRLGKVQEEWIIDQDLITEERQVGENVTTVVASNASGEEYWDSLHGIF